MQNHRESPRRSVSVPATIDSGHARAQGVILDVSTTGARLRLGTGAFLATHCTLTTALFGAAVPSRIVWRRGAEIGLRFKTNVSLKPEAARARASQAIPNIGGFGRRLAG